MKILIIRVGRLGDMVMLSPALNAIRKLHPEAFLDLVCAEQGRSLVPFLGTDFGQVRVYKRKGPLQLYRRRRLAEEIRNAGYDMIFCFETNPSYQELLAKAGCPVFFPPPSAEKLHFSRRALDCVALSAGRPAGEFGRAEFPARISLGADWTEKRDRHFGQCGISPDTFVIAIHPSFSGVYKIHKIFKRRRHKIWPPEHFGKLCRLISEHLKERGMDFRILMNLLPGEKGLAAKIIQSSNGSVEVFDLPRGFGNFAGYLSRTDLLVAPDTGPMHMVAALGGNLIALFSGEDPACCGPFAESLGIDALRAEDTGRSGLAEISPERVFGHFRNKLEIYLANSFATRRSRERPSNF